MRTMTAVAAVAVSAALAGASVTTSQANDATGPGAVAPKVVLQSVIGGKTEQYDLQAAVSKRPVVLYFFPQAFTSG